MSKVSQLPFVISLHLAQVERIHLPIRLFDASQSTKMIHSSFPGLPPSSQSECQPFDLARVEPQSMLPILGHLILIPTHNHGPDQAPLLLTPLRPGEGDLAGCPGDSTAKIQRPIPIRLLLVFCNHRSMSWLFNFPFLQAPAPQPTVQPVPAPASAGADEAAQIAAMFAETSEQWEQTQAQMAQ